MPADKRTSRCDSTKQPFDGAENFHRLRHPPDAGFAALCHFAGVGANEGDAIAGKRRDVALRRLVPPHHRVHRRRHQDRPVAGDQHCRGEIVGMAAGHFRQQIGGRRRHHHEIAIAGEADVADLVFAIEIEQRRVRPRVGDRLDRQRRHEFGRGARS